MPQNRKDTVGGEELLAQLIEPYLDLQTTDVGKYVTFTLFTKENDKGELIKPNDGPGLRRTSFNFNRPTKIITHGYFNWGTSPSCVLMQKGILLFYPWTVKPCNSNQGFFEKRVQLVVRTLVEFFPSYIRV